VAANSVENEDQGQSVAVQAVATEVRAVNVVVLVAIVADVRRVVGVKVGGQVASVADSASSRWRTSTSRS